MRGEEKTCVWQIDNLNPERNPSMIDMSIAFLSTFGLEVLSGCQGEISTANKSQKEVTFMLRKESITSIKLIVWVRS